MTNKTPDNHTVRVGNLSIANDLPFTLLAGPCVLESRDHALEMSSAIAEICAKLNIGFIYKTSFDKANRTSIKGARGLGLEKSLPVLADVKERLGCPIVTDVHLPDHCAQVAEVADVLQIPAFLCRQTDLLKAAAETGKPLNVKKGQFLAPWDMKNVVDKLHSFGNYKVMLCERGTSFGYNTLITDMRGLPTMGQQNDCPVVFDATHSVQQPGGQGGSTGGQREFVPVLARAAMAVGVAAVFMEVHQDPDKAPSDGPNMVKLHELEQQLRVMKEIDQIAKKNPIKL